MAVLQAMRDAMEDDGFAPATLWMRGLSGRLHVASLEKAIDEFAETVKSEYSRKSLIPAALAAAEVALPVGTLKS